MARKRASSPAIGQLEGDSAPLAPVSEVHPHRISAELLFGTPAELAAPAESAGSAESAAPFELAAPAEPSGELVPPVEFTTPAESAASAESAAAESAVSAESAAPVEPSGELAALAESAEPVASEVLAPLEVSAVEADEEETPSPVNYDDEGLTEVTLDDALYRFDAGKQGTAVCLSMRSPGSWKWRYLGELRWDGRTLRSRQLERRLLDQLSGALREFSAAAE